MAELFISIPGYCYKDLKDEYLDVYCKCGKHFVAYKKAGEDCFLIKCPGCLNHYRIHQRLVILDAVPTAEGEVILRNDENSIGNWK